MTGAELSYDAAVSSKARTWDEAFADRPAHLATPSTHSVHSEVFLWLLKRRSAAWRWMPRKGGTKLVKRRWTNDRLRS